MVARYNLYNVEPKFKDFLHAENISDDTLKNYLSDIRHFTGWTVDIIPQSDTDQYNDILTKSLVEDYKQYLSRNNVPVVTINRRLSSLRKYFDFLVKESLLQNNEARSVSNIKKESKLNKIKSALKVVPLRDKESSIPYENNRQSANIFNHKFNISTRYKYIALGTLFLFVFFNISSIAINQFNGKSKNLVEVKKAARGRTLNFKGKLLDNLGNPITSKTDVTFKIYTKESSNKATYIGQCKGVNGVIPDTDGFASILVGKDCHMEPIPQTVFSENPSLYLGVTIGSDKELSPRQQIANVAYSLDSEKLQGLSLGEEPNSVPYFDENGTINLKASESSIHSYSADGTFSITSDGSLLLQSGDNADVTLASGISGSLKFKTGGFSDSMSNLFVGTDGNVGIATENPSEFKLQVAGDVGPENDDTFNLGSETKQWATVYSSKFLQNGVALCDEQGNNCPKNISSWTLSSPYLYTNQANTRVGIGTSNTASIISKLFVTKDINDTATGKALAIFDQTENQDIFTASASGQTRFVVRRNGDTGIGTISPNARLDVSGGQTKIEVSTQYTERLCHSGSESDSSQNVFLGDCSSGGADIAEYYGSKDKDIEAGDIVIAAPGGQISGLNSKGYINKSNSEYDNRIIGIVSTNPYDSFGKSFDKNESIFPVALAGRIPVKISKTSDVIKSGDFITSSSEPGKAMKAKHAGQIIGKALEDWSPDKNKDNLLVFLNISWSDPGLSLSASGQINSPSTTSPFVYNGILEKNTSQIELLNKMFQRATDQEKNALLALWQSKDVTAEKSAGILDIAYSIAQNSLSDAAVKIQNLIVSKKIVSPIVETTDLVASGSSRLSEIHTNNIQTDGKDIEINLDTNVRNSYNYKKGPLAELIIKGTDGRKAASIDADGNATFSGRLAANSASISGELIANAINSTQLQSDQIRSNDLSATNLNSANASISGTLTADNISSNTIRALEQRINALADSSKVKAELPASDSALIATSSNSATIASNNSIDNNNSDTNKESFNIKEIQKLIAQLKTSSLANPEYYHVPENIQNSSTNTSYPSIASLKEQIHDLDLESLTVTGNTNVYKLNAADSIAVGNMIIENNSILALADNLNISAISTITLFDGAITIAHDGTMTTKGAIIARGGIKTDTIEAIDKNVVVKLSQGIKSDENNPQTESNSKLIIANPAGSEVASIDASGSAQFDEISVSKYMDATKSGSLISAEDNMEKHGVYAPAYNADKKAAGIGIIPENSSEVVIYTDKIKEGSLVYLTPTEQLSEGQLSILEKEPCANAKDSCQPYFRVGISKAEHQQIPFNWLIIN